MGFDHMRPAKQPRDAWGAIGARHGQEERPEPAERPKHPCDDGCQYSKDVGMWPEHSCAEVCMYDKHGRGCADE